MPRQMTETYSPPWCPHVTGRYSPRTADPETGQPEEQLWAATCNKCGATWGPAPCGTGMVRQHISTFCSAHSHRNALVDPFPKEPGR